MIQLNLPSILVFGNNCFANFIKYFTNQAFKKVLIVADPFVSNQLDSLKSALSSSGIEYLIIIEITKEPSVSDLKKILQKAEANSIDSVMGIGGGSVLDVSKLIAALCHSGQTVESAFGIGNLKQRKLFLACLPTTAGTGSEVSPNAILNDKNDNLKKGIVSPYLVPDCAYIDPVFTHTVPPNVSDAKVLDALTHCIEAYANKFAHPVTDMLALEGIRLINQNLEKAFNNGLDAIARENLALGSLYGGMCLGPVNTAAVHALAYPLGSEYNIPHGVSNALMLPHVLEANLPFGIEKYAKIAKAIGVPKTEDNLTMAKKGILKIAELCRNVGISENLNDFGVKKEDVSRLSASAFTVQRLLKNNPRELIESDIQEIYLKLF